MLNKIKLNVLFLIITNFLIGQEVDKKFNIDVKNVSQEINNEDLEIKLNGRLLNLVVLRDESDTLCTRIINFNKIDENNKFVYSRFRLQLRNCRDESINPLNKGTYELVFIKKTIHGMKVLKKIFKVM